jgi:hypothetical protein
MKKVLRVYRGSIAEPTPGASGLLPMLDILWRRTNRREGSFATRSCRQQVRSCPLCTESGSKFRAFDDTSASCQLLWFDRAAQDVIEAPKLEPWIVRYDLSDFEWAAI